MKRSIGIAGLFGLVVVAALGAGGYYVLKHPNILKGDRQVLVFVDAQTPANGNVVAAAAPTLIAAAAVLPTTDAPVSAPASAAASAPTTQVAAAQTPAPSQGVVKAQYGDWQMSCDTPPGASFQQCAIIQNVTAEDQPNVGLSVIVLKTADQKARLLRVLAPLGVLLPNGLGLHVDGKDIGRVAFVRCLPNGCIAEVAMDDALIATLSKGTSAVFSVFKTPEEGIGIPVSLKGFGDGFAQLP